MRLTETAETVLNKRYYIKEGDYVEDWDKLTSRVGYFIGKDDKELGTEFKDMIYDLDFLPNSPCLMNAGLELGQLSACFVLPVEDNIDSIFKAVGDSARINKSGGGVGYDFSNLREANSAVLSTSGVASGPLTFIKVFDTATDVIKQGGRRRGANMGVLKVTHPDILEFISAKEVDGNFSNFNFSVALTDEFMEKVKTNETFWTISPRSGEKVQELSAKDVFNLLVEKAHAGGDPGVLFIDTANKANNVPHLGDYNATNPCVAGETLLIIKINNIIQEELIKNVVKLYKDNQNIVVLSYDINKKIIEFQKITFADKTRENAELIKITDTKTGKILKLTPEHKVYTVNRGYVEAQFLKETDKLNYNEIKERY